MNSNFFVTFQWPTVQCPRTRRQRPVPVCPPQPWGAAATDGSSYKSLSPPCLDVTAFYIALLNGIHIITLYTCSIQNIPLDIFKPFR